ncbi:MAG: iron ABC transporter ATP-binding protein [Deltaproteobacteria bacterium]|nr:MAG: iron ABC transporter ATP-binding protein [Deltaproteobacteria bacterium]
MTELKNITKIYGDMTALEDVSLKIEREETVAIVGPSGSGKTTLLRLIAGLESPDSGEIFIRGQQASRPGKIILRPDRRRLGMIFQDLALWPHLTVTENLEFGLKSQGVKKSERSERIKTVLDMVELNSHPDRYPHSLSGGEKQRVALARTVVLEPEIMLMDEPLSSVDTVLKKELQDMIARLVRKLKVTLIYVTHDREEALAMAGRIVVLISGRIVQTGSVSDLLENPKTDFVKNFMRRT